MGNFNFRFIFKTMGFLLIMESLLLMVSGAVSFYYHETTGGDAFLISAAITMGVGIVFRLIGIEEREQFIGKREGFLVVGLSWVILSAFGMLPFLISGAIPKVSDAYFETMSGFTTTGASILADVESMPLGLLFWRSLTQWIGGLGIVVFALAVLPIIIGGNASFLFDAETTGISSERFQPRVTQIAKRLLLIYVSITAIIAFFFWIGPMSLFDAICHAEAAIATGGFSTKQNSIAYWNSPYLEYATSVSMFVGGINFSLIYFLFKGQYKKMLQNEELRWYFFIYISAVVIVAFGLFSSNIVNHAEGAFRTSLFQVTSAITTTGYSTAEFTTWGPFYLFLIYALMLICACAGSTSGGIKIVRIIVLFKNAVNEFKRQVHPNAILPIRVNNQVIPTEISTKIFAFTFLYLLILLISFVVLSVTGISFQNAITASISCIGNVGLGSVSDNGHFADFSDTAKWFLSFLMLTGRLELFTILSLFMPAFWRK